MLQYLSFYKRADFIFRIIFTLVLPFFMDLSSSSINYNLFKQSQSQDFFFDVSSDQNNKQRYFRIPPSDSERTIRNMFKDSQEDSESESMTSKSQPHQQKTYFKGRKKVSNHFEPKSIEQLNSLISKTAKNQIRWENQASEFFKFKEVKSNSENDSVLLLIEEKLKFLSDQCPWSENVFGKIQTEHKEMNTQQMTSHSYISEQDVAILMNNHFKDIYNSEFQANWTRNYPQPNENPNICSFLFCRLSNSLKNLKNVIWSGYKILRLIVAFRISQSIKLIFLTKNPINQRIKLSYEKPLIIYLFLENCSENWKIFKIKYSELNSILEQISSRFHVSFNLMNRKKSLSFQKQTKINRSGIHLKPRKIESKLKRKKTIQIISEKGKIYSPFEFEENMLLWTDTSDKGQ